MLLLCILAAQKRKFMNQLFRITYLNVILLLFNTGCTNVTSIVSNINVETPYPALTNLTETLKCMGDIINKSESKKILILVDDFYDGTVPVVTDTQAILTRAYRTNGPLADGGKYDFEAVIKRTVSNEKIVIPYAIPTGLVQQEDLYGKINLEYLVNLIKGYEVAGAIRVKGVFTQNDSSDYYNKGFGSNVDVEGTHGEVELEHGVSQASRTFSLAIHLGNPVSNIVLAATTLTLNTHTKSDEYSIGVGYGEGSMSFSKESKLKEGMHGAQRTLIEAAAMWMLRGLYSKVDFSQCLGENGVSPDATVAAYEKWQALDEKTRIKYLKLLLNDLGYYSGEMDYTFSISLWKAIIAYEKDNQILIPHTRNNLGDLFVTLSLKVEDMEKIDKLAKKPVAFIQ